jgi:hypothetical protein
MTVLRRTAAMRSGETAALVGPVADPWGEIA